MPEYGLNLWDYWRIIYKRRWIIVSIFLVSVVSAHFFAGKTVPVYKSSVTLNVSMTQPIAEITGSGVTFWGARPGQLTTQLEMIKGYSILEKVAEDLELVTPDTSQEKTMSIVNSLRGKITIEKHAGTSMIDIVASDADPVKAKDLAEVVAKVFMEENYQKKIQEATNTKKFVKEQLKKLNDSITDIRAKLESIGAAPISGDVALGQLDPVIRYKQLKLELANLRTRYTENYPGIVQIREELAVIEGQLGKTEIGELLKEKKSTYAESVDPDRLKNELRINEKLYSLLRERYETASILEASKAKDIEIVNPAVVPRRSKEAKTLTNIFLGGAIGLVLGLLAAFITESLDTSIGTIEDVEEYLRLPVLGVIPRIEVPRDAKEELFKVPPPPEERKKYEDLVNRILIRFKPKSSVSEAYKNLQTYIKFSGLDKVGNCLMFTSAGVREGKTVTSVNSALSMAQLGYKVLLVDTDLRRPSVHRIFGLEREMGLSELILGTFKLEDVIKNVDNIMMGNIKSSVVLKTYGMENINIITAGHLPNNPTEILSSQNMVEFIKEAREKFQVVFFDAAPILPVTDACILSSRVDGVILVYEVGRVARGALRRSKMQIENAKGRPIGIVLNSMRASDMRFGSPFYYYASKYYTDDEKEPRGILAKNPFRHKESKE